MFFGKKKEASSMDKNVNRSKEQQHSEIRDEKRKSGQGSGSSSGNRTQIDRINEQLARPNLSDSARKALQDKKKQLEG